MFDGENLAAWLFFWFGAVVHVKFVVKLWWIV